MSVQEIIETAFAEVPYPGDNHIANNQCCHECDEVIEHFRGTTWRQHTITELADYRSVLPLFTPKALQYFLPAYMLSSLGAWLEADTIPFSISQMFLPLRQDSDSNLNLYHEARLTAFNKQQRAAIAAYLQAWADSGCSTFTDDVPKAIETLLAPEHAA